MAPSLPPQLTPLSSPPDTPQSQYYLKLQLLVATPIALAVAVSVIAFAVHMYQAHKRHAREAARLAAAGALRAFDDDDDHVDGGDGDGGAGSTITREQRASMHASVIGAAHYRVHMRLSARHGLRMCVGYFAFVMDLCYPACTRTILQIFRCRQLGTAGYRLEADMEIECYDARWWGYVLLAIPAAAVYALGVPLAFWWLVRYYRKKGQLDEPGVERMIGWMHRPFRSGAEWWLSVELIRKLVLTGCIGFLARSCHYKLLLAQLVAFAFLGVFLSVRPYRRSHHHWYGAISMCIPALGMSWALTGRAEKVAETSLEGAGYDTWGLLVVHVALLVPVVVHALFGFVSTIVLFVKALCRRSADKIAFAARQTAALAALKLAQRELKQLEREEKKQKKKVKRKKTKTVMDHAPCDHESDEEDRPSASRPTVGDGGGSPDGSGSGKSKKSKKHSKRKKKHAHRTSKMKRLSGEKLKRRKTNAKMKRSKSRVGKGKGKRKRRKTALVVIPEEGKNKEWDAAKEKALAAADGPRKGAIDRRGSISSSTGKGTAASARSARRRASLVAAMGGALPHIGPGSRRSMQAASLRSAVRMHSWARNAQRVVHGDLPATHRAALEMLYRRVAPDKLEDGTTLPTILGKFQGKEDAMYQLLQRMYPAETILRPPR